MGGAPADTDPLWTLPPQRSLPEIVADRVMEAIRRGDLVPGERIVEATLAARLGVSRGPLREALKVLEAQHLVVSTRGRGTRVATLSPEHLLQMLVVRAQLEGLAARLVAGRRTPALLRPLEELHTRSAVAAQAGLADDWRDNDWLFHETLVRLSGNAVLLQSWEAISRLVRLFQRDHPGYDQQVTGVLNNHERLMEVLRSGTPDEAEALFRGILLRSGHQRLKQVPEAALAPLIDGGAEILGLPPSLGQGGASSFSPPLQGGAGGGLDHPAEGRDKGLRKRAAPHA